MPGIIGVIGGIWVPGKTTPVNLTQSLYYDADSDRVLVDGVDGRTIPWTVALQYTGAVSQRPVPLWDPCTT